MDTRTKKTLLTQNIQQCKYGHYANIPVFMSNKFHYDSKFNLGEPINYCDVYVLHKHPLLIVKEMKLKGHNPAVLSIVSNSFDGSNLDTFEGFHDDYLNLRTNYCKTIGQVSYPLQVSDILYTKNLYVIRDENMLFLHPSNFYSFNHIVASPIENPKLYKKKLKLDDYILIKELIETIFQSAILDNNDVLILNDFGCKYNKIPLQDIIYLYNMNILKYGHFFKYIIIATPLVDQADKDLYLLFEKEIIKPQNLINPDSINLNISNNIASKDENKEKMIKLLLNMLQNNSNK